MWRTTFKQFLTLIKKNRFFTFVNLFGISFTIMLVMIMQVSFESKVWPGGPEENIDNMLFLHWSVIKSEKANNLGCINIRVVEEYVLKMKKPKLIGFSSHLIWTVVNTNSVNEYDVRTTNAVYLKQFTYKLLEGRFYNDEDVKLANNVAVISKKLKDDLFGNQSALGKTIDVNNNLLTIIGVIKNVPFNCEAAYSDVWFPYTVEKRSLDSYNCAGLFEVFLTMNSNSDRNKINDEVSIIEKQVSAKIEGGEYHFGKPFDALDQYFCGYQNPLNYKGKTSYLLSFVGKMFLILLIPAISLIALNLTRVQERADEIAVRKTFGATNGSLIKQILFENFLLTLIGGVLGLFLAWLALNVFDNVPLSDLPSSEYGQVNVSLSFVTFAICLVVSFLLSLLSGFIPARRLAKLSPAKIMNGGNL